jgi:hypothetical protein
MFCILSQLIPGLRKCPICAIVSIDGDLVTFLQPLLDQSLKSERLPTYLLFGN